MTEEIQEVPKWLKELEDKREKRLKARLGHETGAGSPCLNCEDKCPGLDLHFWRKICKNCKCGKENHDVNDDDIYGWAQFQLLGSKPLKPKRIVLPGRKDEVELEWMPKGQNDTVDLYLKEVPVNLLPIKGSTAAQQRKLLLQKQIPLHDIDPTLCHALTEKEVKEMNDYIAHVKQNSVGVGHIMKLNELLRNRQGGVSAQYKSNRTPMQLPHSEHIVLQGADRANKLKSDLPKSLEDLQVTLKELWPNLPQHSIIPHTETQNVYFPTLRDLNYQQKLQQNVFADQDCTTKDVLAEMHTLNPNTTKTLPVNYPTYPFANQIDNQTSQSVNAPKDLRMQLNALNSKYINRTKPPPGAFPNESVANTIDNQTAQFVNLPKDIHMPLHSNEGPNSHVNYASESSYPHASISNINQIDNQTSQTVNPPKDVRTIKPLHNINHPNYSSYVGNAQAPLLNVNYPKQPVTNQIDYQKRRQMNHMESLQAQLQNLLVEKNSEASHPYHDTKIDNNKHLGNLPNSSTESETVYPDLNVNYKLDDLKANLTRLGIVKMPHFAPSKFKPVDDQQNPKITNLKDLALSTYNPRYSPSELRVEEENVEPTLINVGPISDIEYSTNPIKSAEQKQNDFVSDVPRKDVTFDLNDIEILPSCHKCKEMFSLDDFVIGISHSDQLWHTDCFKCTGCNQNLADMMYFYHKESNEIYCGRDYAKIKGVPRCQACDELIFVKEYCLAENSTFHVKHFCCFECDLPLAGQQYLMEDLQPLCIPCFEKIKAEKCNACLQIIKPDEQGANIDSVHFHANANCFCCKMCKKALLGGAKFLFKNSNLYCSAPCFNADK